MITPVFSFAQSPRNITDFVNRVSQCATRAGGYADDACSLAVREITDCAGLGTGWCSGSAANYINCPASCARSNSADCNAQFDRHWKVVGPSIQKCKKPGSIRIYLGHCDEFKYYEGYTSKRKISLRRKQCLQKLERLGFAKTMNELMAGDFHGHIEIVGQGARVFHHFKDSLYPINSPQELGQRRILVGCLLPKI